MYINIHKYLYDNEIMYVCVYVCIYWYIDLYRDILVSQTTVTNHGGSCDFVCILYYLSSTNKFKFKNNASKSSFICNEINSFV